MQIAKERVDETEKEVKITRETVYINWNDLLMPMVGMKRLEKALVEGFLQVSIVHDSNNP